MLAWSPLALVEIAGSGHNEAFGMLWMVLALLALDADRPLLVGARGERGLPGEVPARASWPPPGRAATAGGTCSPPARSSRRSSRLYLDAGSQKTMLLSLSKYAQFWRFNETLFAPLAAAPRLARGRRARRGRS